jgi:hypothetical protein
MGIAVSAEPTKKLRLKNVSNNIPRSSFSVLVKLTPPPITI